MITKGNRRSGLPVIVEDRNVNLLERIPLEAKAFNEGWIQKLIHDYPAILPIRDIEGVLVLPFPLAEKFQRHVGILITYLYHQKDILLLLRPNFGATLKQDVK
jgi:hypothetical protein